MSEQVCLHNRAFKENEPPAPKVLTMVRSMVTLPKLSSLRNAGVLRWWPTYTLDKLYSDLSAALTVSVVLVPQGMAYALLAGLPPVYGLYSSTIPVILFGLITSSASVAPGPVAPTAIVMSAMVSSMTPQPPLSSEFIRIHLALAFVTGMFQLGLGVLQQTWVSDLVSYPVMNGFAFGAALIICASQLGDLFGLTVARATGFFDRVGAAVRAAGTWNWRTTLLSLGCLYILLQFRTWSIRGYALPKRFPMPLAIIAAITLVSYAGDLGGRGGIRLVGTIPSQFPGATIPIASTSDIALVASNAAILAVINFMQSVSLAKIFGKKLEEETVPELEMFALGVSSVVGSCMSCYTIAGSFTRTTVQFEAGARTPATTILTGAIMIVFLFTITRILNFLPMCVLAAVVMTSTRQLFATDVALELWRSKRSDFVQFAVTVLAVLVLDIVYGLLAGIGFSLFLILARSFLPNLWELGRLPNTDSFVALSRFPEAQTVPGFKVLRLAGELHFGNVRRVAEKMARLLREAKESRLKAVMGGVLPPPPAPSSASSASTGSGSGTSKPPPTVAELAIPVVEAAVTAVEAAVNASEGMVGRLWSKLRFRGNNGGGGGGGGGGGSTGEAAPLHERRVYALSQTPTSVMTAVRRKVRTTHMEGYGGGGGMGGGVGGTGIGTGSSTGMVMVKGEEGEEEGRGGGSASGASASGSGAGGVGGMSVEEITLIPSSSSSSSSSPTTSPPSSDGSGNGGVVIAVVVDCARITELDSTACKELLTVIQDFQLAALAARKFDAERRRGGGGVGVGGVAASASNLTLDSQATAAAAATAAPPPPAISGGGGMSETPPTPPRTSSSTTTTTTTATNSKPHPSPPRSSPSPALPSDNTGSGSSSGSSTAPPLTLDRVGTHTKLLLAALPGPIRDILDRFAGKVDLSNTRFLTLSSAVAYLQELEEDQEEWDEVATELSTLSSLEAGGRSLNNSSVFFR